MRESLSSGCGPYRESCPTFPASVSLATRFCFAKTLEGLQVTAMGRLMVFAIRIGTIHRRCRGKISKEARHFFVDAKIALDGGSFPTIPADQGRNFHSVSRADRVGISASCLGSFTSRLPFDAGSHPEIRAKRVLAEIDLDVANRSRYPITSSVLGQLKEIPLPRL